MYFLHMCYFNPIWHETILKLAGLTAEEAVCVRYVQHYCSASPTIKLVHIGAYNTWVAAKDLKCLTYDKRTDGGTKWLDDHVGYVSSNG
jgi:hypothetical protein